MSEGLLGPHHGSPLDSPCPSPLAFKTFFSVFLTKLKSRIFRTHTILCEHKKFMQRAVPGKTSLESGFSWYKITNIKKIIKNAVYKYFTYTCQTYNKYWSDVGEL